MTSRSIIANPFEINTPPVECVLVNLPWGGVGLKWSSPIE